MSDSAEGSKPTTPSLSSSSPRSSSSSPSSSQILVYGRIRPSKNILPSHFSFDPYSHSITLNLPSTSSPAPASDQSTRDYVNNQRLTYPFTFHHLFPPSTSQDSVFSTIGAQCVQHLLQGYNSTIFAYGQTGSGKTFTITGGVERYEDRGIIPRTLAHLFDLLSSPSTSTHTHTVRISYLEIYNEVGYDLLDRSPHLTELSQLPQVGLMEDSSGVLHLQGLSSFVVSSCQEALELLFRGDTNRMICETPSNDASSRSHCLFSIALEARDPASSTLRRSKLHLVDLAGSERIKKTQVTGRLFKEAAFINLSLHHLEQVILALHDRAKGRGSHVPYRNSMMTAVLRDSLGGNCKTYMIATLSGEAGHLEETVSTARFAARVGLIRNAVWVEEAEDVEGTVRRLKAEVRDLKDEVRRLRGDEAVGRGEALTADEAAQCKEAVARYLREEGEDGQLAMPLHHEEKVRLCLRLMKAAVVKGAGGVGGTPAPAVAGEVERLTALVKEREAEIARLHSRPAAAPTVTIGPGAGGPQTEESGRESAGEAGGEGGRPESEGGEFDLFRASYALHGLLEGKKEDLRAMIGQAKALGEGINASREVINRCKQRLQARRVQREMGGEGGGGGGGEDEEEVRLKAEVEEEKRRYRAAFDALKTAKDEIEHCKGHIERMRRKMQSDFTAWKQHQAAAAPTAVGHFTPQLQRKAAYEEEKEGVSMPTPPPVPSPTGRGALSRLMMGAAGAGASAAAGQVAVLPSAEAVAPAARTGRAASTGNAQADADIERFWSLRDQLLKQAAAIQGAVTAIK